MSLRTRLTLFYTAFFAVALTLLGLGIFFAVAQALNRGVEQDLRAGSKQLLEIYNRSAGRLDVFVKNGVVQVQVSGKPAEAFVLPNLLVRVFSPRGDMLGTSANLRDREFLLQLPSAALDLKPGQELDITRSMQGARLRSLITPLYIDEPLNERDRIDGGQRVVGILEITRPLSDVEMTLGSLLYILLGGSTAALFVTAAGVAWLSRTSLAPIDQVTRTAQSIVRAEDLGQRVPVPRSQDELHRLSVTINELLGRLEALFTTQKRFVADVSHELRTPLAAMQGNLEVLTRGAYGSTELLQESLADMRRETTRLTRMVNDLLLLAQSDAGAELRQEPVELDTLLLELHRELRPLAGAVQLRIGAEDQAVVIGDRDRLKQALLNLGANALQHTPPGGAVILGLERRDAYACLSVADTGEGIPAEALPHIFDRFYRVDRARSRHVGGAGLGLSIVKWIVEAHHGHVTVASIQGQGSTFAIWLPLASASTADDSAVDPVDGEAEPAAA